MTKEKLRMRLESAYGGPIPDFTDWDWDDIWAEFQDTAELFSPDFIIRAHRISVPTEAEFEYAENFIERHAPRDKKGDISDQDYIDCLRLAQEEYRRLGLNRIPYYKEET